jgi:group I intron endonuclease
LIYQIVNSINGKVYVGQTMRGVLRWNQHLRRLRGNRHVNPNLQADFNEFGEDVFEWSIIQELPKDREVLVQEETNTIQRLLAEGKELYNIVLN